MKKPDEPMWHAMATKLNEMFDPDGNRDRRQWMEHIEADADGCWIWRGDVTKLGYPAFYVHGGNNPMGRKSSAFTAWAMLFHPPTLEKLVAKKGKRWRRCGKRACVRPGCATSTPPSWQSPPPRYDHLEARRLYEEGETTEALALKFGVARSNINRRAAKEGWIRPGKLNHADVRKAWEAGHSYDTLAAMFGLTSESMMNLCLRFQKGYLGPAMKPLSTVERRLGTAKERHGNDAYSYQYRRPARRRGEASGGERMDSVPGDGQPGAMLPDDSTRPGQCDDPDRGRGPSLPAGTRGDAGVPANYLREVRGRERAARAVQRRKQSLDPQVIRAREGDRPQRPSPEVGLGGDSTP